MIKNYFYLVFLLFLFACRQELKKEYEYFSNNSLMTEDDFKKGRKSGFAISCHKNGMIDEIVIWERGVIQGDVTQFYSNGRVKQIVHWQNGKPNGIAKYFHDNGELSSIGMKHNGEPIGEWKGFYPSGKLFTSTEFLIQNGQTIINQYVNYNEDGSIKEKSPTYDFIRKKDTIRKGEDYVFEIEFKDPGQDSVMYIIGNYDNNFSLIDSIGLDTVYLKINDLRFLYTISNLKKGKNIIRSFFYEYTIDHHNYKAIGHPIYVIDSVFVK